jgi:hypothetical protein
MANEKQPQKASYKVLSNLKHDGKTYRKGSSVALTPAAAAPHVRAKVVEPVEAAK